MRGKERKEKGGGGDMHLNERSDGLREFEGRKRRGNPVGGARGEKGGDTPREMGKETGFWKVRTKGGFHYFKRRERGTKKRRGRRKPF